MNVNLISMRGLFFAAGASICVWAQAAPVLPRAGRRVSLPLQQSAILTTIFILHRHSREGGNPSLPSLPWIPAFAGMTNPDLKLSSLLLTAA